MDNSLFSPRKKSLSEIPFYKISWRDIRERVFTINPHLTQLIDDIDPPQSYPLYFATYSYGDVIQNHRGFYFPENESMTSEQKQEFFYAGVRLPAGIILKNSAEIFYDGFGKIIPRQVLQAGDVFGFDRLMVNHHNSSWLNLCSMTSGIRNLVMVPAICDVMSHKNLVRDFGIPHNPPKLLHEQWRFFKNIVSASKNSTWKSELLFFTGKWYQRLVMDKSWGKLKEYVINSQHGHIDYHQHSWLIKAAFYDVLRKKNFKPDR